MPLDLRSLFGSPTLRPKWMFSPGGMLWRLLFAPGSLVGESRSQEEKRVRFFCLDEDTGSPRWTQLPVPEPWWVGIEAVHRNTVLLHGFAKPDMPEHRGLMAFDLLTGDALWSLPEATFWFALDDRLYTIRTLFDKRVAEAYELRTGIRVEGESTAIESFSELRQRAFAETNDEEMLFPMPFDPSSARPELADAVKRETQRTEVVGPVEALEHRDRFLFNFHERRGPHGSGPELRNRLVVLDIPRKRVIHSAVVADHARAPVPDSFFVRGTCLFYVENSVTLKSVDLWRS